MKGTIPLDGIDSGAKWYYAPFGDGQDVLPESLRGKGMLVTPLDAGNGRREFRVRRATGPDGGPGFELTGEGWIVQEAEAESTGNGLTAGFSASDIDYRNEA